ncbi:TetR/AcrR family transcriptional regulator [Nannocystis radixulma]|uniref:TetR/AcrR family transcriptional regulator n=1 Tax=Nannocystis radixulma TaxID=2995305 RepID=A0ABT5BLB7_9BACT|nr:TetR/AcrR family transcriptional regulator [Nannocystis radixulma]MDC0674380.1 TetR/AcrR family transcriptional regulator [Nannocystis radixulma]
MTQSAKPPLRPSAREAILEAAIDVLAANPGAGLDVIVQRAGVGRATLFRHFATRTDLLRAAGLLALAELRARLGQPELVRGPIRARLEHLFKILVEAGNRAHFLLVAAELFDDPELTRASNEIEARVTPVLDEAVREGVIRGDVPGAFFRDVFESMLYGAWTSVAHQRITAADAQRWLLETFLHGFGSAGRSEAPRPAARARKAGRAAPGRGSRN